MEIIKIYNNTFSTEKHNYLNVDKNKIDKNELKKTIQFHDEIDVEIMGNVQNNKINEISYLPLVNKPWQVVINHQNTKPSFGIENFGLAIDKFSRFNGKTLDYIAFNGQDNLYHEFNITKNKPLENIIIYANKKQNKVTTNLEKSSQFKVIQIEVVQNWRLVLNLGETTAFNNGFLLHPIYGIPYLSDTAIKGMVRTYVIENYFKFNEELALKNPLFSTLFGSKHLEVVIDGKKVNHGKQGSVTFLSAFPTNTDFSIEADIINNHNSDYYGATKNYPKDSDKPKIIKFITLKKASFKPAFFCIINDDINVKDIKDLENDAFINAFNNKTILATMQQLVLDALEIKGIGAKTNKGYGRLITPEAYKKEDDKIRLNAEETKKINNQKKDYNLKDDDYIGKIDFFNDTKGFGKIIEHYTNEKIFFHISEVIEENIKKGDLMIFNIGENSKGKHALNIEFFDKNNPKHVKE